MLAGSLDAPMLYLAGDVFLHERVAATHASAIGDALEAMQFSVYAAIYVVSSLTRHATGLRLVKTHALERVRQKTECDDEVTAAVACEIVAACSKEPDHF